MSSLRIAAAMAQMFGGSDGTEITEIGHDPGVIINWRYVAERAIRAMDEPTPDECEAMTRAYEETGPDRHASEYFRAMLHAAFGGKK